MSDRPVRVRFAPSPTGYLHVGGARTAIFNWLFARKNHGAFVLRIEDTDVERSTRESEASLIDDLKWLGLDWDEGPDEPGTLGPYRQSDRLKLYVAMAKRCVEKRLAYPCFCTDELLQQKKEAAMQAGRPPQYDGTCRNLTADEVKTKRYARIPEVVRFIVPPEKIHFKDLIRGDIGIDTDTVGDFVLLRSNGHPTYNFAAAVDDARMGMSHVLRGEEHLANTLRQLLVYRAMRAAPPEFGHLPLILASDRSKLSKRHGASSVGELRKEGYLPSAVVNYLTLLGWSHPDGKEVLSMEEIVKSFSLDRVGKSPSVYDRTKLGWMNGQHIREQDVDTLFADADSYFPSEIQDNYDTDGRKAILALLQDGLERLADLETAALGFTEAPPIDDEALDTLKAPESARVLSALVAALDNGGDIVAAEFKATMKAVGKETGVKGKQLFFPVRAALTGSVHGPDLAGLAEVKGKKRVRRLIQRAMKTSA